MLVLLFASLLAFAPRPPPHTIPLLSSPSEPPRSLPDLDPPSSLLPLHFAAASSLASLPPLRLWNVHTRAEATLRLYGADGALDEDAAAGLDRLLSDARRAGKPPEVARMDRRLLRLLFRAAYHFGAREVELVSGYRRPWRRAEGLHGKAKAVDFRLVGVDAPEVAAYLRTLPRVGVGLYTHPRTRWVHLDVRERSYHWVDGTPPGRLWGAAQWPMDYRALEERDAAYQEGDDLPE
ncbi:MAG: DUF882 domain-containing protein [Polyangiaceae bacterium]|nr:DUF882 domain-containing protein [Polyangiaceae bacterium]